MSAALMVARFTGEKLIPLGSLDLQRATFTYLPDIHQKTGAIPLSQSLPFRTEPYPQAAFHAYFDGLLPEGAARRELAAQLHVREEDYLTLLAHCGRDCIGDVVIADELPPLTSSYRPLPSEELPRILASNTSVAEMNASSRMLLAGVQSKTGLAHLPSEPFSTGWFAPEGLAASTHILKTGSLRDIPYLEYLCMSAAAACGADVARTVLLDVGDGAICSTRFDRMVSVKNGELAVRRLHQEDIAQALGISSGSKYAEVAGDTARAISDFLRTRSRTPLRDLHLFAQALCLDYLLGNCDNHLKNFSLLSTDDSGAFSLAPLYDIVCTTRYEQFSRDMGIRIGHTWCIDEIEPGDFPLLAASLGIAPRALQTICRTLVATVPRAIMGAAYEREQEFEFLPFIAEDLVEDLQPRLAVLQSFAAS